MGEGVGYLCGFVSLRSLEGAEGMRLVRNARTFGIKPFNGSSMCLLYISAQMSYPPSMQRFLNKRLNVDQMPVVKGSRLHTAKHQQLPPRPLPHCQRASI